MLENCLLTPILAEEIAYANLTFIVATPAVDTPTFGECDCMMLTTSNLGGFLRFCRPDDFVWCTNVLFVAYTKLAMVVEAPSKELSLLIEIKRCMTATKDIHGLFGANLLNLARLICFAFR